MKTPQPVIYLVIGTIAIVVIGISSTMCFMAIRGLEATEVFSSLKDVLILFSGVLAGLLTNTRSAEVKGK
jgi:hypothetical protein